MNNINLTVELAEKDRQLLEGLMGSVTLLASAIANAQPKEVQEKITAEAIPDALRHPVDEVSPHAAPEPAEERFTDAAEKPAAPKYTLDDVRAVVQRLIGPGSTKREKAQAIVTDYAVKISAIPVDKYPEVMDRLIKLEKEATND